MSFEAIAQKNPEKYKDIPETRLRGDDMNRLFGLYAAEVELRLSCEDENIKRRFKTLPNGWRDLRMLAARLTKLTDQIQWTIPYEKRIGFERTARRCKYVVMQGPLASKPKPNEEEVISMHDLDELVASAWEWRCRVCMDGDCGKCALGKVLDNVVAKDRDGGSWSTIDVTRK